MHVIVCTFDASAASAGQVRHALEVWERQTSMVRLNNIAIVQKNAHGEITLREKQDIHRELSDIAGVISGSVAWLVYAIAGAFGPEASQMAQSQTRQRVAEMLGDVGFPDAALVEIGQALDAGSFALITLVTSEEQPLVIAELEHLGGKITQHLVPPAVLEQLARQGMGRNE
jgi:uncharacterized membrane protein